MQVKSLARVAAVAALGLLAGTAGAAAQAVDQKALPGTVCVPANPGQAGDFRYHSGAIRNVGAAPRTVECPILRDGFFGGDDKLEELNVFIDQPNRGKTKCTVSVTNVRTGDEQRARGGSGPKSGSRSVGSRTKSTSKSGDRRLIFGTVSLADDSIVHLRCQLPPRGLIRGILWEERLDTDQDESFGAIKGS